jgi:hypothetical protein
MASNHKIDYSQVRETVFSGEVLVGLAGTWLGSRTFYIIDFGDVLAYDDVAGHYTRRTGLSVRQESNIKRALQAA